MLVDQFSIEGGALIEGLHNDNNSDNNNNNR